MREARKTGLLISYSTFSGGGFATTVLEFDASIKEGHDLKAEVTYYPVESGMPVADGVRLTPRTFNADVVHTTTPGAGKTPNAERDRLMAAELVTLWRARVPCSLTTEDGVLENMVLSDVNWNRTQETGEGLFASLSFTEVVIAERQVTAIPRPVRRPVNRGSQQGALYSNQDQICEPDTSGMSHYDPRSNMSAYAGPQNAAVSGLSGSPGMSTVGANVTQQAAVQQASGLARAASFGGASLRPLY